MTGVKSTSVVFRPQPADFAPGPAAGGVPAPGRGDVGGGVVAPFALFCGEDDRYGTHLEVYPRPNGKRARRGHGGGAAPAVRGVAARPAWPAARERCCRRRALRAVGAPLWAKARSWHVTVAVTVAVM